ncbi:MAG: 2Fe-2S iron-sulfur cluster-binding protein [Candidatus Geothermarchaeales archaeon]
MSEKTVKIRILRFTPSVDKEPHHQTYGVPIVSGMSVLDVLDYIYNNLDSTLAYYSHAACHRGICGRCTLLINGKASLACQTAISEDTTIEPLPKIKVVRDLVYTTT